MGIYAGVVGENINILKCTEQIYPKNSPTQNDKKTLHEETHW